MQPIRVMLADDHPVVRSGIKLVLEQVPDITVIGEVSDGAAALELVQELRPDVLLLDMSMPDVSGVDVTKHMQLLNVPTRILALSAFDDVQYIVGVLDYGASGYLTKNEPPATILEAVRAVAHGEQNWLSRRVAAKVLAHKRAEPKGAQLSSREKQVLQLLVRGYNNEQIADEMVIAHGTVRNHLTNVYGKLGVTSRSEAIHWAWEHGLGDK